MIYNLLQQFHEAFFFLGFPSLNNPQKLNQTLCAQTSAANTGRLREPEDVIYIIVNNMEIRQRGIHYVSCCGLGGVHTCTQPTCDRITQDRCY